MDKTTDRKQADRKQIIFTEGAKGGGGKTTLLSSLADFFLAESIPVKLVDADIDNKSRGSLSHLFRGTPVVGYLDTSVVLMDLLSREAQPEAIKRALAAVEKASKDQAAATARIPLLTLVLNTATLIITAMLGMAVGVLIMVLHQTHIDQEHAKAPEARLARDLATIGGSIGYDVAQDGRSITLQVFPGQSWKVRSAQTDAHGTGTITLYDPTR